MAYLKFSGVRLDAGGRSGTAATGCGLGGERVVSEQHQKRFLCNLPGVRWALYAIGNDER